MDRFLGESESLDEVIKQAEEILESNNVKDLIIEAIDGNIYISYNVYLTPEEQEKEDALKKAGKAKWEEKQKQRQEEIKQKHLELIRKYPELVDSLLPSSEDIEKQELEEYKEQILKKLKDVLLEHDIDISTIKKGYFEDNPEYTSKLMQAIESVIKVKAKNIIINHKQVLSYTNKLQLSYWEAGYSGIGLNGVNIRRPTDDYGRNFVLLEALEWAIKEMDNG